MRIERWLSAALVVGSAWACSSDETSGTGGSTTSTSTTSTGTGGGGAGQGGNVGGGGAGEAGGPTGGSGGGSAGSGGSGAEDTGGGGSGGSASGSGGGGGGDTCHEAEFVGFLLGPNGWGTGTHCDDVMVCADSQLQTALLAHYSNMQCDSPAAPCGSGEHRCTLYYAGTITQQQYDQLCAVSIMPGVTALYCTLYP